MVAFFRVGVLYYEQMDSAARFHKSTNMAKYQPSRCCGGAREEWFGDAQVLLHKR
jgi:hypothetical protein